MNPANKDQVLPLILTGPKESADYFRVLDEFIVNTLGKAHVATIASSLTTLPKWPA
jgi:predicted Rossmann-fold nucleotide-binding protein